MTAIHGYLGLPSDWNGFNCTPISLWEDEILPFNEWASKFNSKHSGTLIGYSLGGRLGLHALIQNPKQWERAIIISAHPGLPPHERAARLESDRLWTKLSWDELMQRWNHQPVFAHDVKVVRIEADFDRAKLNQAMMTWSLGNQEDLRDSIAKLEMPITWVVGEQDAKFRTVGETLKFKNPQSKLIIVPNSGHRVLWNQPEFLKSIMP